jgi:hypothetical protein
LLFQNDFVGEENNAVNNRLYRRERRVWSPTYRNFQKPLHQSIQYVPHFSATKSPLFHVMLKNALQESLAISRRVG